MTVSSNSVIFTFMKTPDTFAVSISVSLNNPYFSQYFVSHIWNLVHYWYKKERLIISSILTQMDDFSLKSLTNGMISTSKISISPFSSVLYTLLSRMVFTCLNWYVMLVHVLPRLTAHTGVSSLRRTWVIRRKD